MFKNLSSRQQCSPLSKSACLANGWELARFLESLLQRLTEMMKWLQRLRSAKSSPAPGFFTPTELNKSWEKYMLSAKNLLSSLQRLPPANPGHQLRQWKSPALGSWNLAWKKHGELQVLLGVFAILTVLVFSELRPFLSFTCTYWWPSDSILRQCCCKIHFDQVYPFFWKIRMVTNPDISMIRLPAVDSNKNWLLRLT